MAKAPKDYQFKLHQYPYWYRCPNCGDEFDLSTEVEHLHKDDWGIKSELPLFFECDECHSIKVCPIGYSGEYSFIIF